MPSFVAFRSRNYRLYFFGQSLSLLGTWMQRTAIFWLIFDMTHSPFMVGVTIFAGQFPSFMLSIVGGVVSDRFNRYRVLLLTQITSLVQALMLTITVLSGAYEVWHILTLTVLLGAINGFDVPARQAMVYDIMNKKEHLPNAIALNSSMVHAARLVGPALAGIVLELWGAAACFGINAFSFVAVVVSLLLMKLKTYRKPERVNNALVDLRNGFKYLKNTPEIYLIMLMLALVSLFSLPYVTLLPVYAAEIFHGSASTFGYLNSLVGIGALGGALFLASLKPGSDLKRILFVSTVLFGLGLVIFSQMTTLVASIPLLIVIGFGMMSQSTISNTVIQTAVAPTMRGRVISYYAMAFFGMQPIGGLLVGTASSYVGAPVTLLTQGIITVVIALLFLPFLRKRQLKPNAKMKMEQLEERTLETT